MSPQSLALPPELHRYIVANGMHEPEVLAALRVETARHPQSRMQLAPEQGQLMALVLQLIDARRTLDIGTFTGYSALSAALAMPDEGRVISCDLNADDTDIAQKFWRSANVGHKIDLKLAPALETLDALIDAGGQATFDFAFIDADKSNYRNYFERCFELVRTGGLIAVDNTLWSGRVVEAEPELTSTRKMQEFNKFVHDHQSVDIVLLPLGDGLTLARKR